MLQPLFHLSKHFWAPASWEYTTPPLPPPCCPMVTAFDRCPLLGKVCQVADDFEDLSQGQQLSYMTHVLSLTNICTKYEKDASNGR